MDDDDSSVRRPTTRDEEDIGRMINEFLITIFLPTILVFVSLWAVFRLYLDQFLLSLGLGRVISDPLPFIAIESGYGRFLLLILASAFVVMIYIGFYVRFLRERLKKRDIV